MKPYKKTIWIVIFAIAMGYLESSVVVYLRALYYPAGFGFPMKEMSQTLAITELYREVATLVMILAVSILSAKGCLQRFAWFLVIFSVWDIAYYVFLKVILGWPSSFLTTDILFLLPSLWTGPVIAPILNSLTMLLLAGVILVQRKSTAVVEHFSRIIWGLLIVGSLFVLLAYMKDFIFYMIDYQRTNPIDEMDNQSKMNYLSTHFIPRSFDWILFLSGVILHLAAVFLVVKRRYDRYTNL